MAAFKDSPVKQVVDDLNILNAETAPVPLTVQQCELVDPAPYAGAGQLNTKATLRIAQPDANYSGEMEVHYHRLDLNTLTQGASSFVSVLGVAAQSLTLLQVLQKFSPALAAYIHPELVDEGPYALTRDSSQITLAARSDSLVFNEAQRLLHVSTAAVNIGSFSLLNSLSIFAFNQPKPTYDEDIEAFVVGRFLQLNGYTEPLAKEDYTLEVIEHPDYSKSGTERAVRLTITTADLYYSGTVDFTYALMAVSDNLTTPLYTNYQVYTTEQTVPEVLDPLFQAANVYFRAEEFFPTPLKPVRQADFSTSNDMSHMLAKPTSLAYGDYTTQDYAYTGRFVTTNLFPYEEIVTFQVSVPGQKTLLSTTNTGTMPVTIELLAKPAEFAPSTLAVNAAFLTTESLPVGEYKIRITRPDSYRTPITHRFNTSDTNRISITKVHKLKGHDLSNTFKYCNELTQIDAGALDEATYTYKATSLFELCTALASVPAGLLNNMKACHDWNNAFGWTTSLATIPEDLFGFMTAWRPQLRALFNNAGPTVLPANFLRDAHYPYLVDMFSSAKNIQSIEAGFLAAMDITHPTTSFAGMFNQCSALQAIPEDFFVGVKPTRFRMGAPYSGDWNLSAAFANTTALTTLPANLFQPLYATGQPSVWLSGTFENSGLSALPVGLFDGFEPAGTALLAKTFYGCANLQSLPAGLFQGASLDNALALPGQTGGYGTFQNSGLTSIPATLFAGHANVRALVNTFAGTQITEVPLGLFDATPLVTDYTGCFYNCQQLATVPSGMFSNGGLIENITELFRDCPALTSIPPNTLTPLLNLKKASYVFWNAGLTSIPADFFATNAALENVEGIFYNCPLAGTLENVFTNQPVLVNASQAFGGTDITTVAATVFGSNVTALADVGSLFSDCDLLTSVHADVFKNAPALTDASFLFSNSAALATVPAGLFAYNPELLKVNGMFSTATGLTSIPAGLLAGKTKITDVSWFARSASALQAIPAGIFNGLTEVVNASAAFYGCALVPAVPNQLFKSFTKCTNYTDAFKDCVALTTIGTDLFGNSTVSTNLTSIFEHSAVAEVPDGIFFALKNISSLRMAFQNVPSLTTVGRLVANTLSPTIEIGGLFAGDLLNTVGPTVYPDFTLADNVIDSTIAVNVGANGFLSPFNRRGNLTKNIDNLFGANVKITTTSNSKAYFYGTKVTGSGVSFISKHAIAATTGTPAMFTGVTTLNDYASLPAWAKA